MKKYLCLVALLLYGPTAAMADELAVRPAFYLTTPDKFLNWSGVYFGGIGGFGFGNSAVTYSPKDPAAQSGTCGGGNGGAGVHGTCIPSADFRMEGPTAGADIGFNWQVNSLWLVGLEADYQWSDIKETGTSAFRLGGVAATSMVATEAINSFGTARLRMGVIPMAPLMLYGTGGFAFGRVGENLNVTPPAPGSLSSGGFSYACTAGTTCFAGSSNNTLLGWTVGGGAAYALTEHLILKSEILYVHFGKVNATATAQSTVAATTPASFTAAFQPVHFAVARGGLDIKF